MNVIIVTAKVLNECDYRAAFSDNVLIIHSDSFCLVIPLASPIPK